MSDIYDGLSFGTADNENTENGYNTAAVPEEAAEAVEKAEETIEAAEKTVEEAAKEIPETDINAKAPEEAPHVYSPNLYSDMESAVKAEEYQKLREKADKKAEKRLKKQQKKEEKKAKGRGFFSRLAAAVVCAVLFGVVSAGAFIGVFHFSGYEDKLASYVDAIKEQETEAVHVNTSDTGISPVVTDSVDITQIVENSMPYIVAITSVVVYENQGFGFFFGGGTYETTGAGSGIIIGQNNSELLMVTNYHVVDNAKSLMVTFNDGESVEAMVKGTSEEDDLAVVAVKFSDMKSETINSISTAVLGDSDSLKPGQRVIAIGNALGYGQSVTVGYVSALSREVTISGNTMTLLQTDAAINPGNSGGALINENGEVIGINSAKYTDTDVEGMGFAIPISSVQELIEELMNEEALVEVDEAHASYLGITPADVDSSSAFLYNMPEGVFIYSLEENGPAMESGLMERDIITRIDRKKITSSNELREALKYYSGGTTVNITIQRVVDGAYTEMVIPVTLGLKSDYIKPDISAIN